MPEVSVIHNVWCLLNFARGQLLYCALLHPTRLNERNIEGKYVNQPLQFPTNNFRLESRRIGRGCDGLRDSLPSFSSSNLRVSRQLLMQQLLLTAHRKATDVKVHNQMFRNAIPKFTNAKAVLIGDAAHFMLPSMSLPDSLPF
jgi:hypothetical protein